MHRAEWLLGATLLLGGEPLVFEVAEDAGHAHMGQVEALALLALEMSRRLLPSAYGIWLEEVDAMKTARWPRMAR